MSHLTNPVVAALIQAADAAQALGDRYPEDDGVKQSDELALHGHGVGARLGNAVAQNKLGSMLLNGIGCQADAQAADPWCRGSAEQGHTVALFNLGLRYLNGTGVGQDDRIAGEWIAKSAE
jgi:TPR repeat protein